MENLEAKRQVEIISDRAETLVTPEDLYEKIKNSLETKRPLKVKLGVDPSAPDLHLGHVVVMKKLREFQELGHEIYFVIGDFTGMIGAPSGRSTTRRQLSAEEVRVNAETYREQATLILDPEKTHTVFNSTWLSPMSFAQIIELGSKFTVARMLERDDFRKRYEGGLPIGVHEFLYPLAQAYDSVAIGADLELGGTDQTFNLLVGRAIQPEYGQKPQVCLTLPILVGLDGVQKMSKGLGNYVAVKDEPKEMFGKLMSIPDAQMGTYYRLVLTRSKSWVERLESDIESGKVHPMDAKMDLAFDIVKEFHDRTAAENAKAEFLRVFRERELPTDIPEVFVQEGKEGSEIGLARLVCLTGLASSSQEARRLVRSGAVRVDGVKKEVESSVVTLSDGMLLQVGKRRFCKVRVER
ncbi:MAG: tyrosine--tRNA ligase [Firmicutes bacterium]|nr:tyrosine--tRNA ligase [Candidatus Fermentithermobacillaceae bacterium]